MADGSIISLWLSGDLEKGDNILLKFIGNIVIVLIVTILLSWIFGFDNLIVIALLTGIISGLLINNMNILEGNNYFKSALNGGMFTFFCFYIGGLIFVLLAFNSVDFASDLGIFSSIYDYAMSFFYYCIAGILFEYAVFAAIVAILVKLGKIYYANSYMPNLSNPSGTNVITEFGACPTCGAPIEDKDQEFCTDCGKPLNPESSVKLSPNECPVCGRPVKRDAKICPNCGNPL